MLILKLFYYIHGNKYQKKPDHIVDKTFVLKETSNVFLLFPNNCRFLDFFFQKVFKFI